MKKIQKPIISRIGAQVGGSDVQLVEAGLSQVLAVGIQLGQQRGHLAAPVAGAVEGMARGAQLLVDGQQPGA